MRSAITQRASVPPPPARRATAAQPSSTRANTATIVSRSAAAVRDPTPASSKWTATCSGVSMPSCCRRVAAGSGRSRAGARSEEHTSELQSLAYLVCRLLLEKKKKKKTIHSATYLYLSFYRYVYCWRLGLER